MASALAWGLPARHMLLAAVVAHTALVAAAAAAPCRSPFLWPFAADSVWNTPIGSLALYVATCCIARLPPAHLSLLSRSAPAEHARAWLCGVSRCLHLLVSAAMRGRVLPPSPVMLTRASPMLQHLHLPVAAGTRYAPAHIYNSTAMSDNRGPPTNFHNDQDWIVRTQASDPLTPWINDAGQFPGTYVPMCMHRQWPGWCARPSRSPPTLADRHWPGWARAGCSRRQHAPLQTLARLVRRRVFACAGSCWHCARATATARPP